MKIVSASYNQFGGINVTVEGQPPDMSITVPPDPANKDFVELEEWATVEGNEIKEYVAPPETKPGPTIEDLQAQIDELKAMLNK